MSFNLRVYGLLINANSQVLLSDENKANLVFTKFPGGGLEFGEGIIDCLKREFMEEVGITVQPKKLFYLTEHFQVSAFDEQDQVISIYYLVESDQIDAIPTSTSPFDFKGKEEVHRWMTINKMKPEDFLFPIDKIVAKKLKELG